MGCLYHGPWSRLKAMYNMWLVVELVMGPLQFTSRKKNVKVAMEIEVPQRHILSHVLSTHMVEWVLWWETQKRCYGRRRQGPMVENVLIIMFCSNSFTRCGLRHHPITRYIHSGYTPCLTNWVNLSRPIMSPPALHLLHGKESIELCDHI